MMADRLLFLDIDDVVVTTFAAAELEANRRAIAAGLFPTTPCPAATFLVARLIEIAQPRVVIQSSWVEEPLIGCAFAIERLAEAGLPREAFHPSAPAACTAQNDVGELDWKSRKILSWRQAHDRRSPYVVIDDDRDACRGICVIGRLVEPVGRLGFRPRDLTRALALFDLSDPSPAETEERYHAIGRATYGEAWRDLGA